MLPASTMKHMCSNVSTNFLGGIVCIVRNSETNKFIYPFLNIVMQYIKQKVNAKYVLVFNLHTKFFPNIHKTVINQNYQYLKKTHFIYVPTCNFNLAEFSSYIITISKIEILPYIYIAGCYDKSRKKRKCISPYI